LRGLGVRLKSGENSAAGGNSQLRMSTMQSKLWSAAFLVSLLAALPADAEIIKGVMAIKGAEMS